MKRVAGKSHPARPGRPRHRKAPLGIKTVERALDVVDAIARSDRALSLTELSVETGMEPSKLHRYLVSLCARGLTKQISGDGLYDLGPGALSLGAISLARLDDFAVLREAADRLNEQLRESIFIYVWSQAGPVLVHNRRPAYALVNLRIGSVVPLVNSATGPIFVAYLPEDMTRAVLLRDAEEEGLDPAEVIRVMMQQTCRRVREDEVLWSDTTIIPNSAACAAPIFDAEGNLLCVMGASFYQHGLHKPPQAHLIAAVKSAAHAASKQLGYVARVARR